MDMPLWTGEVLTGKELAALDGEETLARHVLARAGLELVEGVAQVWKLAESELDVRVERAENGRWRVIVASHEAPAPLAVVYASAVSGEFDRLSTGTFPRWEPPHESGSGVALRTDHLRPHRDHTAASQTD
jgi:hypothetical protein